MLAVNLLNASHAVVIDPDLAEGLLKRNDRNRHLSQSRVTAMKLAMLRGEWRFNGDPIRISPDGRLLDGQHRLAAVVASGCSIACLLVEVDDESQKTMDQGARRSFGDMLQMRGVTSAKDVAAAVKLIWAWELTGVPSLQQSQTAPTTAQLEDVLARHPEIMLGLQRIGNQTLVTKSFAMAHWYVFSRLDVDDADEFFRLLRSGEELEIGNPILTLRDRLIRERAVLTSQLHATVKSAFFHRAFLAWRDGQALAKLLWKPGGAKPDRFPIIDPERTLNGAQVR